MCRMEIAGMVKFDTLNVSTNISIDALQLHVCIANVHLSSSQLENLFLYIMLTVTSSINRNGPYN